MTNLTKNLMGLRNRSAWLVLVISLVLTWVAWSALRAQAVKAAGQQFNLYVDDMTDAINDRMRQNEQILLGGAGLFAVKDAVSRTDWRAYVERLHLDRNYPGIQGMGFGQAVSPSGLQAHIAAVQAEGFPGYRALPVGRRPLHVPIVYLEPFSDRNLAAFGFDMMSEASRASAMQLAAESGSAAITRKVRLQQETHGRVQAGFLMYVPVYDKRRPLGTAAQRRVALKGFVFSPYRINDLMRGIVGERQGVLDYVIFDGMTRDEPARLFASAEDRPADTQVSPPRFTSVRTLAVFGQTWSVQFQSRPGFDAGVDSPLHLVVPVLGASIGVLLFFLLSFLTLRRNQAQELASSMRTTLYERDRHQEAVNAHAIVSATDAQGRIVYVNDRFCAVSGYSPDELLGQNHRLLKSGEHPPEFYEEMWQTVARGEVWQGELCNRCKDGSTYWVASSITPFLGDDGKPYQYVSIRTEITALKVVEQRLRLQNRAMEASVNGISIVDAQAADKPLIYVNPAFERITGYSAAEVLGRNCRFLQGSDGSQAGLEEIRAALREHRSGTALLRNFRKSGELFWNELMIAPVLDGKGQVTHYIGVNNDITKRKRAEEAADSYKERLRRGQFFANIGTWEWHIQSGELFWTERIAPLFGYPQGDLDTSYDNFVAAIHPDDRPAVTAAIQASLERDAPYDIEHRVVWPDGTVRWLLERGAVIRDAEGKPLQMLGVVQDIHERKQIELALAESEKLLREAQSLARLGHWHTDVQSGALYWSQEIFRMFGQDPAHFKPSVESFQAAVHPDDRGLIGDSEKQVEQTGCLDVVHRIVWPNGSVRHVHEIARAECAADGQLLRLVGTVQDVTDFVEAKMKLREIEERFVFAVEGAGDGIWDWNIRTGAVPLSGNYEGMLGYDKGELVPTIDAWVASVHPEDLARVQQMLQDYLIGSLTAYVVELRLRCKDGGYKWILCRGTVVARDGAGVPVRMIGIHSDITENKAAQAALVEARETAERANQAKSDFLSSMSHELRTPMNAVLGFAQMLEHDASLNADQHDSVDEILKAGRHLLGLITEVLDLAKIESGRIDLSLEPVDLLTLASDCRQLLQPLAAPRQLTFELDVAQGTAVRADRLRLKQVLLNLLSNAVKYNREAGSIRLSATPVDAGRLRVAVADTGLGIPADRIAELFQPFNRLEAEYSDVEGTGIGLTITRQLVELMGGQVGVDSEVGVGSTFWFELPSETRVATDAQAEVVSATPLGVGVGQAHLILCIDDNPANLKLVSNILGRRPHTHLLAAPTPELGIELAMARRPALVLLDINMPGLDGYRVLDIFKASEHLKDVPVVAVTANAMARDIERGRQAGFVDYVTKPVDVQQLLNIIDACLSPR